MSQDNCNCGHDNCGEHDCCGEHDFQRVTVSLDGEEDIECNVLGTFEVEGREYIALQPLGEEEVMIFRYSEEDGEVRLDNIETDEEHEEVAQVFYELFDEDFEDDEFDEEEDDDEDEDGVEK